MIGRKEEGMLTQPTFNVSVIFGKRDEVRKPTLYSVPLVSIKLDQLITHLQPMLVACARQLIENIRYLPPYLNSDAKIYVLPIKINSFINLNNFVVLHFEVQWELSCLCL